MKTMKGKLLKKLKSVQPIGYLKQDWILQVSASDGFIESFSQNLDSKSEVQFCNKEEEQEQQQKYVKENTETDQEPDIIDVAELMKELEKEEEIEIDDLMDDKENIGPISIKKDRVQESSEKSKLTENGLWRNKGFEALKPPEKKLKSEKVQTPLSEIDISSFRRPDLNSRTLFDPNLLEAFQQAVMEHMLNEETEMDIRIEEAMPAIVEDDEPSLKTRRIDEEENPVPLLEFEEKIPPGGINTVIFYTTTLKGVRKTFEDCNSIRFLLDSFKIDYQERDISMHIAFREEMWRVLGDKFVPPRLFIKGRYIGGAEEVLGLHEQEKLRRLFDGIPVKNWDELCDGCFGIRFIICLRCNGSQRIALEEGNYDGCSSICPECNENGLILCPVCC